MKHFASAEFWAAYDRQPKEIREMADKNFALLKDNPQHPSLHFKKAGRFWSARVGIKYRALAVEAEDGLVWFWIGTHTQYDRLLKGSR